MIVSFSSAFKVQFPALIVGEAVAEIYPWLELPFDEVKKLEADDDLEWFI